MPTKDGPAKRLDAWIAHVKTYRRQSPAPVPDVFLKSATIPSEGPFAHPDIWQPVRDAFKAFELDVEHPGDWQRLLYCLAEAHFGKRRGNPKAWDENRLCRLRVDFLAAKRDNPGKSNEEKIYKLLLKKDRYQSASVRTRENRRERAWRTLKRQMPAARAAYKRTVERLATTKLAWDRKHGNSDVTPAAKQAAIKFAKEALEASAAPLIKGPGDDAFWNTVFGDPTDRYFWRSDASFWFGAELPQSPKTPRLLDEADKQEELNEALDVWRKRCRKREN
jgi:hypothetical protein